jgi:hypothetical protein
MLYLLKKENIDAVMLKWIDHERISPLEIRENLYDVFQNALGNSSKSVRLIFKILVVY